MYANVIANAIVAAYINGATGVKIVAGNVEILSATEVEAEIVEPATVEETAEVDNNDNDEVTAKFEVGKTYYGVDFGGEWSEDAPVTVKTLRVIKRTAKTFTAIDESGNQVSKRISLAYAGTKEVVTVPSVNDITVQSVNVYSDKEFTPAIAAAPTGNYKAWLAVVEADNNVETEAATVESELPTGEITVDSGAEAWSLVGEYFPNGLKFTGYEEGFNREDTFYYTNDKTLYAVATCTPDNSRVECVEVVDTNASGSKRKPLTVYIKPTPASDDAVTNNVVETCATVQIATDSAPVDDFSAKLAALDAEIAEAENARNAAKAAYNKADAEARNAIAARQEFLDNVAGNLTRKLQAACVNNDFIQTTTIHGRLYTIGDFGNVYIDPTANGDFAFVTYDNRTLARYDTPAQIEAVIARIKDTIDRKDVVFYFPTIDELNKPATADSLTRAMKIALDCYKGFCYVGNLTAAERELKLYNICRKAMTKLRKE